MKSRALALVLILAFSTVFAGAQYVEIDKAEVSEVQTLQSLASEKLFDVNFALVQIRSSVMATVYLNFTFLSKQTLLPDQGITEVYKVTIFTNGQVLGRIVMGRTIGVAPSMDYRVSDPLLMVYLLHVALSLPMSPSWNPTKSFLVHAQVYMMNL